MKYILYSVVVALTACTATPQPQRSSAEQQIRDAVCQIENRDYAGAQAALEKVVSQDPQNIYAQRLLPGAIAGQIKKDDRSAANREQIKKSIEAYNKFSSNAQFPADERADAEGYVVTLYESIGGEEGDAELLAAATDESKAPKARSRFYTSLAGHSNTCARDILLESAKPAPDKLENARSCLTKGLEYSKTAVELDPDSDSAWSYRASLLQLSSRVAKTDNDVSRADSLRKDFDAAKAKLQQLSAARSAKLDKDADSPMPGSTPELSNLAEELVDYSDEKPLDRLVPNLYFPVDLYSLVAPPGDGESEKTEPDPKDQPREWRQFSPNDELSLDLPDNASASGPGSFDASGNGVGYLVVYETKAAAQAAISDDRALNTLAWTMVRSAKNLSFLGDKQTKFDAKLLNKDAIGGQPARTYSVTSTGCSKAIEGTLLLVTGKKSNYAMMVFGANAQDPRTQRLIKSVKFRA